LRLKPENSNFHGFEPHRPSIKNTTKILLKVIKAIIIIKTLQHTSTGRSWSAQQLKTPRTRSTHKMRDSKTQEPLVVAVCYRVLQCVVVCCSA